MPRPARPQLRGLLLVGTLAGAIGMPCAVFALTGAAQSETLIAARGAVAATPLREVTDDRPGVRQTVAMRPPVHAARPVVVRASRTRRALPAVRRATPPVVDAPPMSGTLAERVLAEARRHEGAPYSYGAAGPRRFDCSGFTMYVFGRFGISLPHSSSGQASVTTHIPDAQKQPGDLIFTYRGGTIGHVGIYAGGTKMWAAVETGDVVRLEDFAGRAYQVGRVD